MLAMITEVKYNKYKNLLYWILINYYFYFLYIYLVFPEHSWPRLPKFNLEELHGSAVFSLFKNKQMKQEET